jgi:hypothetical protein
MSIYFVRGPYAILHKLHEIRDASVGPSASQRRDEWILVRFVDRIDIEWKYKIGFVGMMYYRARNTARCRDLKIVFWNTTSWWLVICYVLVALPASTFRVVLNMLPAFRRNSCHHLQGSSLPLKCLSSRMPSAHGVTCQKAVIFMNSGVKTESHACRPEHQVYCIVLILIFIIFYLYIVVF